MNRTDVTVHIDEDLDELHTQAVRDVLQSTGGVVEVRCAEHRRHLLVVEYDPRVISSGQILDRVSAQGLHAELIGL